MSSHALSTRPASDVAPGAIARTLATAEAGLAILDGDHNGEDFRALCMATPAHRAHGAPDAGGRWNSETEALLTRLGKSEDHADRADRIASALTAAPDRKPVVGLVGMLLDSFPSGRPANLDAYASTIVHDLVTMGFSPAVVALACRELRRSTRFLPSVSEVIEAAGKARETFESAQHVANSIATRLRILEARRDQQLGIERSNSALLADSDSQSRQGFPSEGLEAPTHATTQERA